MQSRPLITIILPIYNSESTVVRCVESILHQTYTNFELLIINDGSTDSSEEKAKVYCEKDRRVKLFSKENGGVSSARNVGLDNAIGEWITFADSDDFTTADWLKNFVDLVGPEIDFVGQGFQTDRALYADGDRTELKYGFRYVGDIESGLKGMHSLGLVGFLWAKMFRKSLIDAQSLRFNTAIAFKEDEEFVLRYLESATFMRHCDSPGYCYHVPDWEGKYIDGSYQLYERLWCSVKAIYRNCDELIVFDYLHNYLNKFLTGEIMPSASEALRIKRLVGSRLLRTSYPSILKWTLYIDPTGYVSYLLIVLYRYLKK